MTFDDLGLSPEVLKAISDAGYSTPTPIQEKAIPYVLMGRDVLGCAQTGTGKTASFTLPMIEVLATGRAKARMPRSLILEPTRELATQVAENFEKYGKYHKLNMALLIGGSSMADQERVLDRGVDVLIATPGRLLDLFERGKIILADVKILVIDEADRMLDMGFIPDVEKIVSRISKMRQTLFFSATMPPEIRRLADAFLMNPKEVTVSPPTSTASTIEQRLVKVRGKAKEKRAALRDLMRAENPASALIFCNRKREVGVVFRSLQRHGFSAAELHGDMSQPARTETLAKFKAGDMPFLVCSDVAARGLDIPAVSHVFNFDVPSHAEDYIHRIGRTGRAGRSGKAITIAGDEDMKSLAGVTQLIGRKLDEMRLDGSDKAKAEAAPEAADDSEESASEDKPGRRGRSRGGRRRGRKGGRDEARAESQAEAESAEESLQSADPEAPEEPVSQEQATPEPAFEEPEEDFEEEFEAAGEQPEDAEEEQPAEASQSDDETEKPRGRSRGGRGRRREESRGEARGDSRGDARGDARGDDRRESRGGKAARDDKDGRGRGRGGRGRGRRDEDDAVPEPEDGSPFGDQIPAFLLRPAVLPAA